MRILFITHEKSFGGASRALINLVEKLDKKYEIFILAPSKKAKIVEKIHKENVHFIFSFYTWWQYPTKESIIIKTLYKGLYYLEPLFIIPILHKVKNLNIDIIHSNTSATDIGAILARKLNKPHIWHFREYTGDTMKFIKDEKKCFKYINESKSYIIFISKSIRDFYQRKKINCKFKLVYDGIDYSTYKKQKRKDNIIKFLFVGTLEEKKGQMLCVNACNELKKKGYNNFELVFVGNDPTKYSEQLNAKINEYNLKNNVKYIGYSNNVNKLRTKFDVELMCSKSEAFGLVTVEAMAMGNPVIGSNSGATPEIIDDKKTGFLYELNNYKDLADKMKCYIDNKKLISKHGTLAKKIVMEKFSINEHTLNIEKIYKEINNDIS